ncbi:MAG TPA: NrfD/PsrC family molybdoenzyme membrane anchor subunit [Syntrophorhabdales bacterium]|nr:NrfD/PsrC family molybdoenzyme membrane anchor subunit [Syntrophorhabdales bacterium]
MNHEIARLYETLKLVVGFIYPNEIELGWNLLIVVYPYITGLVAGAFILASLVKVFKVKEVQPTYRLALLTALSFLIVAPLPLVVHLTHPERGFEMFLTPSPSSAMAMFGFVYVWYLMAVLLLEIWFDYRKDFIVWAEQEKGYKRFVYKLLSLFTRDTSPGALSFDKKAVYAITVVGIPSAFLLHGYVGFIFGSVKANPWWSSVLMPIVFLFSAIVSGIALVLLIYMVAVLVRGEEPDMACIDKLASFLFYMMIVDFSLEFLDFVHRIYQSEESIHILGQLISERLFVSLIVIQLILGMILPLVAIALIKMFKWPAEIRRLSYFIVGLLVQFGIFSTRWNVVIGGQLFSKSFRGLTAYKMAVGGVEGLLVSLGFLILPFIILYVLIRWLPPWEKERAPSVPSR